jgi:hypothetical protein
MTEEITLISQNGLSDDTYQKAKSVFSENKLQIIMAIVTINSWNRIALSTRLEIGNNNFSVLISKKARMFFKKARAF